MRAADHALAWLEAASAALSIEVRLLAAGVAVALLALALWVAWRRPALMFVPALASLAVRPQLLWGDSNIGYEWGLNQTLLVIALAVNALHFGLRTSINWPLVALVGVLALNLIFGNLHHELTTGRMFTSLSLLALPFTFTHVILAPDARRVCTLVIVFTPILSVAFGLLFQIADIRTTFDGLDDRLEGATGNSAIFGLLAFAGFAVALHESTVGQRLRPWLGVLASINLAFVILSGTRMSMLASAVLLLGYVLVSQPFRESLWRSRAIVFCGLCLVGVAAVLYTPTLYRRILTESGRTGIWQHFYDEFWQSPIFGRGIGSAFIAENPQELLFAAPHNEYLHLVVIGGVLGFVLCGLAIAVWYSDLIRTASPHDRYFVLAIGAALAVYAITDNILVYPTGLAVFVYLGTIRQSADLNSHTPTVLDAAREHHIDATTHPAPQSVPKRR